MLADLTGLNPNVLYELGIAHTFDKKTIVITQDDLSTLPFDLKQYRAKDYSVHFKKFADLIAYLEKTLNGAVDGSIAFSNPVKDFLTVEKIELSSWFNEIPSLALLDNSEKGIIDFLAEIEENSGKITAEIVGLTDDMEELTTNTNQSSKVIDRINQSGGGNYLRRNEVKKVASYVDTFSCRLRQHNEMLGSLWDNVEINTLGLLVVEDLTNYLNFIDKMRSSIDIILAKSKFVVGEIDFSSPNTVDALTPSDE